MTAFRSAPLTGVRVLLADDHRMVRLGFRLLLEGAGAIVAGEADSGETALKACAELQPDLLVMDVSMPGMGGLAALERLLSWQPDARVLMLSMHHDEVVPVRALKLGARGYLCKQAEPEEFLRAVGDIAQGRRYLDPALAQSVAFAQLSGATDPVATLTDKELAVFLKLASGLTVNEVATDFHVSPSTVGTHLYHIKQKLNVSNAAELTLTALRHGLLHA